MAKTINKLSSVVSSVRGNTRIPLFVDKIYTLIYIQTNTLQAYACCKISCCKKFLIISFEGIKICSI